MKIKTIITILIFLSIISMNAQEWVTNFEDAQKMAKEDNKEIIMSFQGSDWCAPCIKLEKEFFSNEKFKTYAKDHFVMLKVDFPRRKKNRLTKEQQKHNNNLAEKYNQQGNFPLVVVLNKDLKVLGKTGYNEISVTEFISKLEKF